MSAFLKAILSAMNLQQVLVFIVGTLGVIAIKMFVPVGPLQTILLGIDANLVALITTLVRTPSAQGGTTSTAAK